MCFEGMYACPCVDGCESRRADPKAWVGRQNVVAVGVDGEMGEDGLLLREESILAVVGRERDFLLSLGGLGSFELDEPKKLERRCGCW